MKLGQRTKKLFEKQDQDGTTEKIRTTLYLPKSTHSQFKKLCSKKGLTVSEAVVVMMEDVLENYPEK